MTKVRIGLIGCGAIAEIYHLPALAAREDIELAFADTSKHRLASMQSKYNPAVIVQDYHTLRDQVDGVIVATPPNSHFEIAHFFLSHGTHVLCEKPLTEDYQQAIQLVQLAHEKSVALCVNQTRRFFPSYQKIRELIGAGELGELQRITYHDGVEFDWPAASPHHFQFGARGAWSDTGVHLLDSICYWLDSVPTLVNSQNDSFGGPEAVATVNLLSGSCQIEIKVSRLGKLMNGFEIVGTKGTIVSKAEAFDAVTIRYSNGSKRRFVVGSNRTKYVDFARPMISNFVSVVRGSEQPTVSGQSTLGTIRLLQEAYDHAARYSMPWNSSVENLPAVKVNKTPMRVLVTGASGFLGGRVVEAMVLGQLAEPVAAIRHWSRAARVARHDVDIRLCDICNPTQVDQVVSEVDAIVHCAKTDDRESIVGGTRNLIEAALRHSVHKFVFLSTAEVYGAEVSGDITESAPTPQTGRLYGDCKLEAEDLCRQASEHGLKVTILRPSIIYGPFSSSWSIDLAKRLQSGKWGIFEDRGNGIANLIYVDDLVQAILLSLSHPDANGQTFNVNGPQQVTWNEYFSKFNESLCLPRLQNISSKKSRFRSKVIGVVDWAAGKVLDRFEDQLMEIYLRGGTASKIMKRIKGEINSTPSQNELHHLYCRSARYNDRRIRERLGYSPQITLDVGLMYTSAWLELHELVDYSISKLTPQASTIKTAHMVESQLS
ncbi:MAG: NAD-dependent epimerase/dehydratase family protein [Planctomycetales bacterium]|nr:NAD-dependent epimerase/dehydratase family protein [Planctomycetales bacterium]